MITHLEAIQATLSTSGWQVFLIDATGVTKWPYILLAPGYASPGEVPLASAQVALEGDIRVTIAGTTPESVLGLRAAVLDVLSPQGLPTVFTIPDRHATLQWLRHEMTEVDRDVTVPATDTHPIYTVDTFHLISQPL